jgi:hypothetical protein
MPHPTIAPDGPLTADPRHRGPRLLSVRETVVEGRAACWVLGAASGLWPDRISALPPSSRSTQHRAPSTAFKGARERKRPPSSRNNTSRRER